MRWVKGALMVAVSVGLLAFTAHTVGLQALLAGTEVLNWWTIPVALACGFVATAAQALRWKLILHSRGTRLTWLRTLSDCYSSSLLNMILPGGLGGDLVRVAVYRNTGEYKWWSPLTAVAAERLSATTLVFTAAATTLVKVSTTLALITGTVAVTVLVIALYGMRQMERQTVVLVWLTAGVSVAALFLLYVVVMVVLGGPVLPALAMVALAAMSLPIGLGGWGVREFAVNVLASTIAISAPLAVATATGYGLLAIISVLPGVVTLIVRTTARRSGAAPAFGQNAAEQRH